MANQLFSWIWTKLSGRASSSQGDTRVANLNSAIEDWGRKAHALLSNEANWRLVRESLGRLEGAGLRIAPDLDRDLIVARFLRDAANWCEGDDLARSFAELSGDVARDSVDLLALEVLARESDAFSGFEDIDVVMPKLSSLPDEALDNLIADHSDSVFENAYTICVGDEHAPGDYVPQHVRELEALAGGDFTVQSVNETTKPGLLVGMVTLSDGTSATFQIGDEKRQDLTPFLKAMNSLIAHLEKGRFVAVDTGNVDEFIVVYLRSDEPPRFREWSERQRFADGSTPSEWLA